MIRTTFNAAVQTILHHAAAQDSVYGIEPVLPDAPRYKEMTAAFTKDPVLAGQWVDHLSCDEFDDDPTFADTMSEIFVGGHTLGLIWVWWKDGQPVKVVSTR